MERATIGRFYNFQCVRTTTGTRIFAWDVASRDTSGVFPKPNFELTIVQGALVVVYNDVASRGYDSGKIVYLSNNYEINFIKPPKS